MAEISRDQILAASATPRWAAMSQIGGVSADVHNFDTRLLREPRLLVPVDLQALVVRAGVNDGEKMIVLPFRDSEALPPLDVHDAGAARPPGVHLLWSVPTALGRGKLIDDPQAPGVASRRLLKLPVLPDRWVVLRLVVPLGATKPTVAGWVIEADTATSTPLTDWPVDRSDSKTMGTAVPLPQLNMQIGGAAWTQCYDAAAGRLALHDPLDDLAGVQVVGDSIAYVVAGWWSAAQHDPLDGVGSERAYASRLAELGWTDPDHPSTDRSRREEADNRIRVNTTFGLVSATRYMQAELPGMAKAAAGPGEIADYSVTPTEMALQPAVSGFLHDAIAAAAVPPAPTHSTLLHGRLHGVPLHGGLAPENRPGQAGLRVVIGSSTPDLAGTLSVAGTGMGTANQNARRAAERLLAAFTSGLIMRLGETDAWSDVEAYEHGHGFGTLPGGSEGIDRFVDKPGPSGDPGSGFRPGQKLAAPPAVIQTPQVQVMWSPVARPWAAGPMSLGMSKSTSTSMSKSKSNADRRHLPYDGALNSVPPPAEAEVREVARAAPRFHQPAAPVLAIAGGGRNLTAIEREEADRALFCRLSDQVSKGQYGLLTAAELLTTIGSAAVPYEALDLARETLAEDPYLASWRTRLAAGAKDQDEESVKSRFVAESAISYAYYAADSDLISAYAGIPVTSAASRQRATEGLVRMSSSQGVWAHPEGVTMWGQPWRPMFCDWEASLELGPLPGWRLDGTDLDPDEDPANPVSTPDTVVFSGRSPLVTGVAGTLAAGIDRWLTEERQRDLGGHGLADADTEDALADLRETLAHLDLMSVALDGIRERLLGLGYDRGLIRSAADNLPDGTRRALAVAIPRLLAAGRLTLTWARLVDAFGRRLNLPLEHLLVPARVADTDPGVLRLRPRLTTPARWRFDLVDATSTSVDAALARIDQAEPNLQVTPVAGYLLPDHMDESLEVFAADGRPLGELLHDPFSDAVTWEIAPGRTDVPPAAGPTDDPDVAHHRIGWIAAGLVAADATARQGTPDRPETESALSAMLRAIDTTLWTVDPFGSLGREHIAGLVGRPIAVVAARLSLDVHDDTEERAYGGNEALRTGRAAAYQALSALELEVRLGEVTRSDDGVLGYFVDDDYSHFHVVDKVIAAEALPSGRCLGPLAIEGPPDEPVPIDHPYVDAAGVLRIHPGQVVRLTLLMHPGGKVHLSSGILPRTSRALARDWIEPGLKALAPSLRVGPLLIDRDKVRLPKVASFPAEQLFTHRDTPVSWRDDPILAATQSALLPDQVPEVQEGWVRIAPNPPAGDGG